VIWSKIDRLELKLKQRTTLVKKIDTDQLCVGVSARGFAEYPFRGRQLSCGLPDPVPGSFAAHGVRILLATHPAGISLATTFCKQRKKRDTAANSIPARDVFLLGPQPVGISPCWSE
jgi:hypothetical protein